MDPTVVKTLVQLGTYGPLGIMAVLGFMFFLLERKKASELTAKLMELSAAHVASDAEERKAMAALGNLYEQSKDCVQAITANTAALTALKEAVDRLERPHGTRR